MVLTKIVNSYPALIIEGKEKNLVITDLHIGFEDNLSQNNIFLGKNTTINESIKEVEKDMAAALKPLEGVTEQKITGAVGLQLDEVGISTLHKHIKSGKTIEQIAKLMRLSVQTVKNLTKGLLKNSNEQVKRYAGTWTKAYDEVQQRAKQVNEEILKEFTDAQIATLKKEYEPFRGKSISVSAANKLKNVFERIPDAVLKKLKDADIPFLSSMALTKMILKGMPTTVFPLVKES